MEANDKKDLYQIIRAQIVHENDLVNHRMTWILLSQAFLFAAFFTVWTIGFDKSSTRIILIDFVLPLMGIPLSYAGLKSIREAFDAIKDLRQFWFVKTENEGQWQINNHRSESSDSLYSTKMLPDISYSGPGGVVPKIRFLKNLSSANAAINIPMAIIMSWVILIVCNSILLINGLSSMGNRETSSKELKYDKLIIVNGKDTTEFKNFRLVTENEFRRINEQLKSMNKAKDSSK